MVNRNGSARKRTGFYLLTTAVVAGMGAGTAAAAPPKALASIQKNAPAALAISEKPRKKRSGDAEKASASRKKGSGATKTVHPAGNLPYGQEDPHRPSLSPKYVPTDLVELPSDLTLGGKEILLRQEVADTVTKMVQDAAVDGVTLKVVSGYRGYDHQNRLYQAAIRKYGKNQKMVGRPGRSEHFLGTTIDVTNDRPEHLLKAAFGKSAEYRWLEKNASRYGWKFTVRAGVNGRKPHQDEPWHIRYMGTPEGAPGAVADRAVAHAAPRLLKRVRGLFSAELVALPPQLAEKAQLFTENARAAFSQL